jgi:hypothetical protein
VTKLSEAKWTTATRAAYYKSNPENFAGPDGSFPIRDASDVGDAWGLAGHADNPDAVRAKIKSIAKRLGLTAGLPDTAKDDGEKQESAATVTRSVTKPRKKIATLQVCWLEYNARSLNGRIYPKATCDAIYQSAMRQLADPQQLAVTSFVSHEAANGNINTELVGGVSRVWQEGNKFLADIDLADTRAGWDILALAEGRYLRSESMRVLGVELRQENGYDLPLVVPIAGEVELLGIDLTTRPGLTNTARIQQVLYESSAQPEPYTESFSLDSVAIQSKEEAPMSIPLFLQIITGMQEGVTADRAAHQRIHDHLAGVMDDAVAAKHGQESAGLVGAAALSEEGRAIAQKHAIKLSAAHDEAARACGMECEGCYKESLGIPLDPDQDGDVDATVVIPDDDDGDESTKAKKGKIMTEEEMLAALKAKGYSVEAPKTVKEQLADLKAQVEALKAASGTLPPQRQTLAATSQMQEDDSYKPEAMYATGDYLRTSIHPKHWRSLAGNGVHQSRAVPWPKDADPWSVVKEMAPFMAAGMMEQEAAMMHREITTFVGLDEEI